MHPGSAPASGGGGMTDPPLGVVGACGSLVGLLTVVASTEVEPAHVLEATGAILAER